MDCPVPMKIVPHFRCRCGGRFSTFLRLKTHYHYHCQKNPWVDNIASGFSGLRPKSKRRHKNCFCGARFSSFQRLKTHLHYHCQQNPWLNKVISGFSGWGSRRKDCACGAVFSTFQRRNTHFYFHCKLNPWLGMVALGYSGWIRKTREKRQVDDAWIEESSNLILDMYMKTNAQLFDEIILPMLRPPSKNSDRA